MSTLTPFDPLGELPELGETVLLEASAGTGKTWTIGTLVARYVAAGVPLERMLVITFGRAASQEMRERVRERLREVHAGLVDADPDAGAEGAGDPVVEQLRAGDRERAERRLREALTHFDAATIATTHQFCQLVLRGLGVAGDTDPRARLVEDLTDLREEVTDDLYVRGFAGSSTEPAFTRAEAGAIARAVTENPHAELAPDRLDGDGVDARKLRFAHLVRAELDRRKRRLGVLGFDDLLSELATALEDPDSPARSRMRDRWQVVLVDEFQDTDPVQWDVLRRAFAGHSALVLVGDPKQAIYGFRGGDVDTYLEAAATAERRHTLAENHRSDGDLVRALTTMMRGAELGSPGIVVREVDSASRLPASRLSDPSAEPGQPGEGGAPGVGDEPGHEGAPGNPPDEASTRLHPVRLRAVPHRLVADEEGAVSIKRVRPLVAADCAAEVTRMLAAGITFDGRALRPGDIAVLAHTRMQLDAVRTALTAAGVPSIIVSSESIYTSTAAQDWLTLLEAMAQSHRAERVRAAALGPFFGHRAAELADGGDELVESTSRMLRSWAEVLQRRGIAAVLAAAAAHGLDARVLRHDGGERQLTDLRHVAELLHQRVLVEGDGLAALTTWLTERRQAARQEERTRRLDSDADAVNLATIHGSKGLQYPVVLLPFVADRWRGTTPDVLHYHRADGKRCLDIGIRSDADRDEREARHAAEEDGESLRLFYVAMTRAQSQVVAWWFPAGASTPASPLHRMLFGRDPGGGEIPPRVLVPPESGAAGRLRAWAGEGAFALEVVTPRESLPVPDLASTAPLTTREWTRQVDHGWVRTSYTGLTRPLDAAPASELVTSEPDLEDHEHEEDAELGAGSDRSSEVPRGSATAGGEDEPGADRSSEVPRGSAVSGAGHVPSPMADLPVGATFGNLVHAVLEEADPGAADLHAELMGHIEEQLGRWTVADLDRTALADALVAVCDTPLGPLAPGATLRGIGRADRLCEMAFELPLAGGDAATEGDGATLGDLASILREHLPVGDPVRGLADALDDPAMGEQHLRGYLTGSVDVVLRTGGRYLVVDYKTNWLGPADEPLTTEHYTPAALHEAMGHSSYPLQALLYAVVLHRFLRWRLPAYDPEQHLGGVLYLYLRGMAGPDTPVLGGHPTGVFSWQPPVDLVAAVSDLLDGRTP